MKLIFVCFLLLITSKAFTQDFKSDWKSFKTPKEFEIQFSSDTSNFLDKPLLGNLIFKGNVNKEYVSFYVYSISDIDSAFRKKEYLWLMIQSCLTFRSNKINFSSFRYKTFYYLLKPCSNCKIDEHTYCENLARLLAKYTNQPIYKNKYQYESK